MASLKPKHFVFLSLVVLLGPARSVSSHLAAPPTATAALHPVGAYADLALRGSATFSDPDGDLEGVSTYRWLVNGSPEAAGDVPQSLLLPLDGGLLSTDGQAPGASQGLAFVAGRFGQAVRASAAANSLLAYPAAGNVDPHEGSLEMWINLTYDLADPAYDDDPRLFAYDTDGAGLLHIRAQADRIIIRSCNGGNCYGAWPDPPDWQAGAWHHLAATWSATANRLALYYDCVLVAEDGFSALAGSADHFHLGSGHSGRAVMDAAFDDVRLSRRALSADEVAVSCSRNGPAPNDEVLLLPGQVSVGDLVTFELTPCDDTGACGAPARASATVTAPPLGLLDPVPGLLPSGAVSVTLSLTTTAPANCRWSEQPHTPYDSMPHDFQQGQRSTLHSTVVSGVYDLDERRFYVRCQDLSSGRDPDDYERQTHLRVLGPWDGGYPRIAKLWGEYEPELGPGFYAGHDLFIPYWWPDPAGEAQAIRAINPNTKILMTGNAAYGWPDLDPLTTEWWNSLPGDPGYNCLLRDSSQQILLVEGWGHPMYNLTQPYCRAVVVQKNAEDFLSSEPDLGADLAYDGIYWDGLGGRISWLGEDIDSDLDGQPDDPDILNAAYRAGLENLLTQVRARLPHVILTGNEAPQVYAPWINGRCYEWQLRDVLNGVEQPTWDAVAAEYRQWAGSGQAPHTTFIFSAPEAIYRDKHNSQFEPHILPAFQAEAAASYRRMRFGLISALMGDGLFFYDLGEVDGPSEWYDEFGAPGNSPATTLPPGGYLGQPTGDPVLLVDELDTPDLILNGGFEEGLNHWSFWANTGAGAVATVDIDPQGGVSGSAAAHFTITSTTSPWDVLLSQYDRITAAGQSYTLSFWARSDLTRTVKVGINQQGPPGTSYGFYVEALVTPEWQHFHLWDEASVTAGDGQLAFGLGERIGDLWLDEVQLQAGALGVWARPFEHGLAVINSTREIQTAPLPGVFCKLHGSQAPLFQARVDDDQAQASAGWSEQEANREQFGGTVHLAPGGSAATVTYAPVLAYGGTYEVLAWVAPTTTQSSAVSVTIRHAQGETVALLDETAGEVGWHSLGRYTFSAGGAGRATLTATGSGAVVADAFKWVSAARYNDGTQASQVTLQPLDGIVLLSSCHVLDWQVYLPLVMRRDWP